MKIMSSCVRTDWNHVNVHTDMMIFNVHTLIFTYCFVNKDYQTTNVVDHPEGIHGVIR